MEGKQPPEPPEGPLGFGDGEESEEERERRREHRRDPDLRPEPGVPEGEEPPVARVGARYSAIVGVLLLLIIVGGSINAITTNDGGTLGLGAEQRGEPLSEFAVPDARSSLQGDANVSQDACETSEKPCPRDRRRRAACEVKGRGVIRVCDFFDRPFVLSFWFTRGGECESQQDVVDRVARRYRGRVGFLSLNVRDDRGTVRRVIQQRGWELPVGHDRDGAVSNLYRVGGCPTIVYAYPGGVLHDVSLGQLDDRGLTRRVRKLARASVKRAREDR